MPQRAERAGELAELRRLIGALRALYAAYPRPWDYQVKRAQLRDAVAHEVHRLRQLPEPWTLGQLAEAFGVSRASIQQWERPQLDRRRAPPGHVSPVVWIGAASALVSCGLGRVVCHLCSRVIVRLVS